MTFEFQNFCSEIHSSHSTNFPCMGSYLSMVFGIILLGNFFNTQRKIFRNFQRAVAGYTANTVCIEAHVTLLNYVAIWALVWGMYMLFDVSDPTSGDEFNKASTDAQSLITCIVYAGASFLEANVLFLLISNSFGQKDFLFALRVALAWAGSVFLAMVFVFFVKRGHQRRDLPYENVGIAIAARDLTTIIMQLLGWLYSMKTAPDRFAIHRFILLMIVAYSFMMIGRILGLTANHEANEIGLCFRDVGHFIYFSFFATTCYITLKRDSQYWTFDDDHHHKLPVEDTFGQMDSYKDVVIPRTELYFRRMLEDRMDIKVAVYLWRRQFVVVKWFHFDLLTRDNIKFFKQEANAFRRLSHVNIVKFLGVVIDPPSLGIAMEYCKGGDLFGYIRQLRSGFNRSSNTNISSPSSSSTTRVRFEGNRQSLIDPATRTDSGLDGAVVYEHFSISAKSTETASIAHNGGDDVDVATAESSIRVTVIEPERLGTPNSTSSLKQRKTVAGRYSLPDLMNSSSDVDAIPVFDPIDVAIQIATGMEYLHRGNNIHRDLKSMNVLLDDFLVAKIADFGDACSSLDDKQSTSTTLKEMGTPGWSAPELTSTTPHSSVDVFSFGIILWELLTWLPPILVISTSDAREFAHLIQQATVDERLSISKPKFGGSLDLAPSNLSNLDAVNARLSSRYSNLSDPLLPPKDEAVGEQEHKTGSLDQEAGQYTKRRQFDIKGANTIHTSNNITTMSPTVQIMIATSAISNEFVVRQKYRPPLPLRTPARILSLLKVCWASDPKIRPSFSEILVELKEIKESGVIRLDMFPFEICAIVNTDETIEMPSKKNRKV